MNIHGQMIQASTPTPSRALQASRAGAAVLAETDAKEQVETRPYRVKRSSADEAVFAYGRSGDREPLAQARQIDLYV